MRKLFLTLIVAIASCNLASAFDLTTLGKILQGNEGTAIEGILNAVISKDNVDPSDLVGSWQSTGPAVSFKSENLLQRAGGSAIATTIENKLDTYYQRAGLEGVQFTFNSDNTFTMTLKNGRVINGTVTKGSTDGTLVFQFGKAVNLGKITVYVTKGTTLDLLFDATKLRNIVSTAAKVTGNSTVSTVTSLLNSYKGIYAGFKLQQVN